MYKKAHNLIRENPEHAAPEKKKFEGKQKRFNKKKLTSAQRKSKVAQKKASFARTRYPLGELAIPQACTYYGRAGKRVVGAIYIK